MFENFIKIAFRSLRRDTTYSFINIIGLSIGIASSILIMLWVYDEVTFNQYFKNYRQISQVKLNNKTDNGVITTPMVSMPMFNALSSADSRIERVAMTVWQSALLSIGEKRISKRGMDVSDQYLEMFDYHLISGDPKTALDDPRSIVISKSTAKALFGDVDPFGKMVTIKIEKDEELKVTGVFEDSPENITLAVDFLLPFSYFEKTSNWVQYARDNWDNYGFWIFVELQKDADLATVNNSIRDLVKKNNPKSRDVEMFLQPMSHWRLYNNFINGKEAGGNIDYVILFTAIAIFILVIACINFMNMATARSEHRAREVGIRKSIGSSRKQLIFQFMGESLLISAIAFAAAVAWVQISLPMYNSVVGKALMIDFGSLQFWMAGLSLVLITGLLAGSYPSFYLSAFQPAKTLKGKIQTGREASLPRKVLVTLQFGFSIVLIVGTVVIYKQIEFLHNRDVGYDRENLMLIWSTSDIEKNYHPLKETLESSGAALSVCKSNSPITRIFGTSPIENWTGMQPGQRVEAVNIATEYDYTKTMGIRMLAGRDFSSEFRSDTAAIILNETLVKTLGLADPIGDKIRMWSFDWTIIGVMEDVVMGSGVRKVDPLVMTMDPTWSTTISVRLPKTNDTKATVAKVEEIFKKFNPDYPFEYRFADAEFEQKFSTINMVSNLGYSFTLLAIFITALGLFGMAAFTAEQRTKEIGIRKVMGASVVSLVMLLTKDFSRMVIIAFILSAPVAIWVSMSILHQYQLHIDIPVWVVPVAGLITLGITLAIVSAQALRAANANPVKALRSE